MAQTANALLECIAQFPQDRSKWGRRLREVLDEGRLGCVEEAVRALCEGEPAEEPAKLLLTELKRQGSLTAVLRGVHKANRQRCRELLTLLRADDPRLHLRIAQRLTELLYDRSLEPADEILYLFDAVVHLNGFSGLGPAFGPLKEAKDPRLRAKAALLSAVLPNGRHLVESFHEDPDPRMRACIVESLWPGEEPAARLVYEEALRDPQPRVKASGLVGLYRLGDLRSLNGLTRMAESPLALHRAVARWALEAIREPRLEPWLARLRSEFGSPAAEREPCYPDIRPGKRQLCLWAPRIERASGKLRVILSVRVEGKDALEPALRPIDLRTWVDGEPVLEYTLGRVQPAGRLAVGVVLPLSLRAASERTLGIRGTLDLLAGVPEGDWRAVGFYRSGLFLRNADLLETGGEAEGSAPQEPARVRAPVFAPDSLRFKADLKEATQEINLAAEPGGPAQAMLNRMKALQSTGHVGVVLDEASRVAPRPQLLNSILRTAMEAGFPVHLICLGNAGEEAREPWLALSRLCGGFQVDVAAEDLLPEALRRWMLCFRETYLLEFEAPAGAREIRMEAVHACGTGEVQVPADALPVPS